MPQPANQDARARPTDLLDATRRALGCSSHLTAAITRRVLAIEERGFESPRMMRSESFVFGEMLTADDVSAPTLPEAWRIRKVRVRLPNGCAEPAALRWEQKCWEGMWEVLVQDCSGLHTIAVESDLSK